MNQVLQQLRDAGARPAHVRGVLRAWLAGEELDLHARGRRNAFPASLIERLPRLRMDLDALAQPVSKHPAADGSERWLLGLRDGRTIESVLLPREGLCVSTQVGCAVACRFCATGREGLVRNLAAEEILAQVVLARRARGRRGVRRVVLMGMGEPSHNLPAVLDALDRLGGEGGFAHKNLVFSTVGDRRIFDVLAGRAVRPAIALSLHTTDADLRRELLPRAPQVAPEELLERAEAYARATTYPIQVQWTLLEGVNDGDEELERLVLLLRGRLAIVNFIPFNDVDGTPYRRPAPERGRDMVRFLRAHGVLATIRRSAGQDVEGACGQLRARAAAST